MKWHVNTGLLKLIEQRRLHMYLLLLMGMSQQYFYHKNGDIPIIHNMKAGVNLSAKRSQTLNMLVKALPVTTEEAKIRLSTLTCKRDGTREDKSSLSDGN